MGREDKGDREKEEEEREGRGGREEGNLCVWHTHADTQLTVCRLPIIFTTRGGPDSTSP